ncbi:MAG: hypothetical protein INR73_24995 [Williamsia sp.]|nr:hypothetical protein [Williamsia sp.]
MSRSVLYRCCFYLLALLCAGMGCQPRQKREIEFRFDPPFRKEYRYALTITSASLIRRYVNDVLTDTANKNITDSIRLDFTVKNIYDMDSILICKLTFHDFRKKIPQIRARIIGLPNGEQFVHSNPFALFDSVGYYIRGRSIQLVINRKGIVKRVDGIEDLIDRIAKGSHNQTSHVRRILSDYISENAMKDMLNRIFTVVPQATVQQAERWVRNVTLVTKAPVKISNLYTLTERSGDTAFIDIESIVSATQSEGGSVYMKGKQTGHAQVSYMSGMPIDYETSWETITSVTSHLYDVVNKEHFHLNRISSGSH